ncbi:alcohol dehydrogenase catalytic domain-containing protein [Rhodococcus hoagii]|nr:alcohol dehydrogenase catalytic domain-containing protein [Prescottella equi]
MRQRHRFVGGEALGIRTRVSPFPRINGHEIVGIVEDVGVGARSDGVRVGDRVAVNPFSGAAGAMPAGRARSSRCAGWPFRPNAYGYIPTRHAPALWGGYSTHVYIHPNAILHPSRRAPTVGRHAVESVWLPRSTGR